MEQLQGSFCLNLQGDPKIIKDLEDQRICSKRTHRTIQCGTFHRDTARPHPGAGESCNGYTIRQNIGRAAHEDNIRAIEPIHSPHRKTHDSTSRERPAEKIGTSFNPGRAWTSGVQQFDPVRSNLKLILKCVLQERTKIRP